MTPFRAKTIWGTVIQCSWNNLLNTSRICSESQPALCWNGEGFCRSPQVSATNLKPQGIRQSLSVFSRHKFLFSDFWTSSKKSTKSSGKLAYHWSRNANSGWNPTNICLRTRHRVLSFMTNINNWWKWFNSQCCVQHYKNEHLEFDNIGIGLYWVVRVLQFNCLLRLLQHEKYRVLRARHQNQGRISFP